MIITKRVVLFLSAYIFLLILLPVVINSFADLFKIGVEEIEIYNSKKDYVMRLDLDNYIMGVVAAEMPASFNKEALKAQAVAARTYALKKDRERLLTTDSRTDQAWSSKRTLLINWGIKDYFNNYFKIAKAVEETSNLVLEYNGDLATTVYHSSSGDYTADAAEVWGAKVDYLVSVKSLYETDTPYYKREIKYSGSDLKERLAINTYQNLEVLARSNSDRVVKFRAGDKIFTGQEVRSKLGLYSTKFEVEIKPTEVKFITQGFGHGVGMSQYGANGMAMRGYNFEEILAHYYPDTEIKKR